MFNYANATILNITTNQSTLLALKAHVSYDPHHVFTNNWSTSTSVCNWVGVITCGSKHLRVKALNLSYMGLVGAISPHIGNLSFLVSLSISNNSFQDSLPNELSRLYRLEYLNFQYNELSGEIPSRIGLLTKLQFLGLSGNKFGATIPPSLSSITCNEFIYLGDNQHSGSIPSSIFNIFGLQRIILRQNKLTGPMPSILFNMPSFQIIDLSINLLVGTLPMYIFDHLPNLQVISLSKNQLHGQLPSTLYKCSIPSEIGNLHNLEMIITSINGLVGPIPFKIFNISMIQAIYMWYNKFSGHLPSDLDLSSNSLLGLIPEALGNLWLLEILNLDYNNLTMGSQELSLFFYLSNCKDLRIISFAFNPLHSFLPNSIGNLSLSLQRLYLSSCNIKGSIPAEIGNLSSLILLRLSNNKLQGPIPTTLGRLHMLQILSLRNNKLEGYILSDLCDLKNLSLLLLDNNKLFGHIPTCISNLTSLRHLYLSFNQLTSTIPLSLWSLTDLLEVDLSSNSLTGLLSLEIGDMKVLRILNLSKNQLSGDIPITFGGLIDLTTLSLAVNQLEGSIPEIPKSLEALLYLKYLNVSFNNLRGKIPIGGPFVHFWSASFISNDDLCGAPRLQVPPCKEDSPKTKRAKVSDLMKYLLPAIGLAMLVMIPSLAYKICKIENPGFPLQADLYNLTTWRRISHQELLLATRRFNTSNLLDEGSFGSVYKGTLLDGMNIAVKVINLQVEGAFKCYDAKCEVLRNARHRNLVTIISICSNVDFKALVLEYMPNENLEECLYSHDHCLNFLQRLSIMIDVASALEYLHYGYSSVIVHCDLKPSNILLDVEMVAHIADFGMAKLLGDEDSMMQTMTLATLGYMAPGGVVSTRGDAYSYGILLIETFTRKKPTDDMFAGEMSLKHWVNEALPISTIDIVDANLLGNERYHVALEECISSIMGLTLDCCAELPEQRTNMKIVLAMLKKIKTKSLRDVEGH
ncbi:hypothetical protein I3760_10G100300 [Carya illinoinensis]|nr:hypothetical protein I3760_10G100300 [Carya illinoinensis]